MGTFLSLHRKSPLLVSRWCSAWVFMWCSTFFSCSVFCERRLALLQTSQSRDVYLWNPPPPRLLWMSLKVLFCILVSILTTAKIVTMWTQKLLECTEKKKKKRRRSIHLDVWGPKTFGMLNKNSKQSTDGTVDKQLKQSVFLEAWRLISDSPPPNYIGQMCLQS